MKKKPKTLRGLLAAAAAALLAACAMHYPQTAQEFREAAPGAFMAQKLTFKVNRPWRAVARTFKARAPECLSGSVRTVSQSSSSYQNTVAVYKPTVVIGKRMVELSLQRHYASGVLVPGKEPPGGLYMLVADATPVGRHTTRIDIYGPSHGADPLIRAIRGWATGRELGCPDMTKI